MFSKDLVTGGLYYWTTSGQTAIMRYDFGSTTQVAAEKFVGPEVAGNGCIGCHALSHDGKKIVLSRRAMIQEELDVKIASIRGKITVGAILTCIGATLLLKGVPPMQLGFALLIIGIVTWAIIPLAHRSVSWRITSDRLMEQRGILATSRREVELQDIRSIEVTRQLRQRLAGLGNVVIASAASADYMIRMTDVYDPDGVAETVRKARLKRLA